MHIYASIYLAKVSCHLPGVAGVRSNKLLSESDISGKVPDTFGGTIHPIAQFSWLKNISKITI